jgi:hypothetical protein
MHELSYGNRVRQDSASAKRINNLLKLINELEKAAKGGGVTLDSDLAQRVSDARGYKIAKTVEIDLQTPGKGQARPDDEAGLRDFSPGTIAERRKHGHERAAKKLNEALANDRAKLARKSAAAIAPRGS